MKTVVRKELYHKRLDLIKRAIAFEPLERIPVAYAGTAFSPNYMGVKMSDFVSKSNLQTEVLYNTLLKLESFGEIDALNQITIAMPVDFAFSHLWLQRTKIPGRELPDDSLWQIEEKETMTIEDYDYILKHGWKKFKKYYMPRIGAAQTLFGQIKMIFGMLTSGQKQVRLFKNGGWPCLSGGVATIPFESLCGGRSMSKFYLDIFRMPDKLQDVMDIMLPDFIEDAYMFAKMTKPVGIWIGGWRSASGMIGPKQWDRLVFPYYLRIVEAVAALGLVPVLHFDQDWTRDLERFKELPAKKCLLNLDGMTDIREAKKILDGHMAILGDIPSSLFSTGTPEDISNYVYELVNDVGPTGLILCPGCDAPINTKPENMEAFIAAANEYGGVTQ